MPERGKRTSGSAQTVLCDLARALAPAGETGPREIIAAALRVTAKGLAAAHALLFHPQPGSKGAQTNQLTLVASTGPLPSRPELDAPKKTGPHIVATASKSGPEPLQKLLAEVSEQAALFVYSGSGDLLCLTVPNESSGASIDADLATGCADLLSLALAQQDRANSLEDETARLGALVDQMPVLVFAEDADGATTFWNKECERVTGFVADEIVNAGNVHEKLYPNEEYRRELLRARKRRGPEYRYWEWDVATNGGTTKRISWSSLAAAPPSDKVASWQVGVDLTERLRVQEMVIRAKQEWERTFDSVPDIILILDLSLAVRRLNMAAAQKLGRHPREIVGAPLPEIVGTGEIMDRIRFMAHSDSSQTEEMTLPMLEGHYLVTLAPYTLATDHRIGSIFIARDVSQRRALEEQLHQSQKMEALGTLAGGIAHDFNTVIGVISGYAEMLLESEPDESPRRRMLEKILGSGERAKSLVSQILTFSRQAPAEAVQLRLVPLIEENLKLMETAVPPQVEVTTHYLADNDLATADPVLVGQIVMNLCANAFHAMQGGGTLEVSLEECFLDGNEEQDPPELAELTPGRYLRLGVRDSGHGMSAEVVERLFDPFYTTKRPGEGTGMGMAVVHGVARRLGGAVVVDSEPGKGTAIGVFLPQARHMATMNESPESGPPAIDDLPGGDEHILLVSQDRDVAPAERDILEKLGYAVALVDAREDALEWVGNEDNRCDLAITDLTLARGNGLELAAAMTGLREKTLPVVLCTAPQQIVSFAQAEAAGVSRVLTKPLFLEQLARTIRHVLDTAQ